MAAVGHGNGPRSSLHAGRMPSRWRRPTPTSLPWGSCCTLPKRQRQASARTPIPSRLPIAWTWQIAKVSVAKPAIFRDSISPICCISLDEIRPLRVRSGLVSNIDSGSPTDSLDDGLDGAARDGGVDTRRGRRRNRRLYMNQQDGDGIDGGDFEPETAESCR